jgi:hypothetical protein
MLKLNQENLKKIIKIIFTFKKINIFNLFLNFKKKKFFLGNFFLKILLKEENLNREVKNFFFAFFKKKKIYIFEKKIKN